MKMGFDVTKGNDCRRSWRINPKLFDIVVSNDGGGGCTWENATMASGLDDSYFGKSIPSHGIDGGQVSSSVDLTDCIYTTVAGDFKISNLAQ